MGRGKGRGEKFLGEVKLKSAEESKRSLTEFHSAEEIKLFSNLTPSMFQQKWKMFYILFVEPPFLYLKIYLMYILFFIIYIFFLTSGGVDASS
jgi:hypothetical protein